MARFRKIFQGLRHTSTIIFTKPAAKPPRSASEDLILEPPHTSPRSYQQIHASPTIECWNSREATLLRVMNPDDRAESSPSPPSRPAPPPPPSHPASLHEIFHGDDITPESFELQVTDEQEDSEPEEALFSYPPRPSSRLDMRLEELSPLDGSLFPPVITFKDSPFPVITIREANAMKHRTAPPTTHPLSESEEIFATPPLEHRLTRKRRRVVETVFSTENLEIATNAAPEQQLIRLPRYDKPLPPTPRDETERFLQRVFIPAAEETRQEFQPESTIDDMLETLDSGKEELAGLDTPTGLLDYNPPTPPIWHSFLTSSSAHLPSSLAVELGSAGTSWHSAALWAANTIAIGTSSYLAFQRESRRWRARTTTLDYNGRTSRFDRDYFTHRSDRRKRFLTEDWEHWMEQVILERKLARRISPIRDNLGEFSIDFEKYLE